MSKQIFIIILVALLVALVGWMFYVTSQEAQTEPVEEISIKWGNSSHADRSSEAFIHWDEDEPPEIPVSCAQCHSTSGYIDFLGEDGSAFGMIDKPSPIGSIVSCEVCHNETAHSLSASVFPSGDEITGLGMEANCIECHQGRTSTVRVEQAIADLPLDEIAEDLGFINIHYKVAAATQMGTEGQAGYQFAEKNYVGRFKHAESAQSCIDCHDPHAQTVNPDNCAVCHSNVVNYSDFQNIRMSKADYDGDGNTTESIAAEIDAFVNALYAAMQTYSSEVLDQPIIYSPTNYPYFFNDTNNDRLGSDDEITFPNGFSTWSPRLLRAAYNYHFALQDGGAYVHNPRYLLQLLYDSLEDLSEVIEVDLSGLVRP
jgi:hypothetical protein